VVIVDKTSVFFAEILNESSSMWETGPELPISIIGSQMIEESNGGVILIGGTSFLDTLFHLPHGGPDAKWTKM
jgi:hypothetical protein